MKLIHLFSVVLVLGFTSCKKRYSCDCNYIINGSVASLDASYSEEIKAKNKEEAQPECDEIKANLNADADNSSINCELK